MGTSQSRINYIQTNIPFKLVIQLYPYFHNSKNNEWSGNLSSLLVKKLDEFKIYLMEILGRASKIISMRYLVNYDNIFLSIEDDSDGNEYIIIEVILRVEDKIGDERGGWYDIFFGEEVRKIDSELLKQGMIMAIYQTKYSLFLENDIYFGFRENDLIDFRISQ